MVEGCFQRAYALEPRLIIDYPVPSVTETQGEGTHLANTHLRLGVSREVIGVARWWSLGALTTPGQPLSRSWTQQPRSD
jgi:hypothetical protein